MQGPCAIVNDGQPRVVVRTVAQRPPIPKLARQRSRRTSVVERGPLPSGRSYVQRSKSFPPPDELAPTYDVEPKTDVLEDKEASDYADGSPSLIQTTAHQRAILAALSLNDFMSAMALSILAPFFPKEAAVKGITTSQSGWVFGVFALVQCFTSPLFAKMLPRTGGKFLSLSGQFFAGGCTVLFGITMAVGSSATTTAGFAIAAQAFPWNPTTVMGLLETSQGIGLMVGPALGGALYEIGGFGLPFYVIGSVMVLSVPFCLVILPKNATQSDDSEEANVSFSKMLKVPAVSLTVITTVVGSMTWVVLDPTLEPHLRIYNLTPTLVGLVFLLMAACYAVCSPIWGYVADNVYDSSPMMVIGFFFTGVGFITLGPSPIFGVSEKDGPLYLNIVAMIIIGLATSLSLVPTYDKILDSCEKAGIPESLANYSVVAGLWNAAYSFGEFLGPVLAGSLVGVIGFPWTMTGTAALCFMVSGMMLILYIYERKYGPTGAPKTDELSEHLQDGPGPSNVGNGATEQTPLLGNSTEHV